MADNHDGNPGQQHEDDLLRHFENEYAHPSASPTEEDANIERTRARDRGSSGASDDIGNQLQNAEKAASDGGAERPSGSVGEQEENPNDRYRNLYRKHREESKENRKRGGRRGIFIGVGAGGGLISIVAGFSFMLPFKLPGIMDTIVDRAGARMEEVVERRAERVVLRYILQGSRASLKSGTGIATGNPLGDLFANIRTSSFEDDLLKNTGLSFEPGPNKTVRLVHNGESLGNARNPEDIVKILGSNKSLSRADIRKIVKSQIPSWRLFKRAKFVKWLRLKYNVPHLGTRKIKDGESEDDYNKAVQEERINTSNNVKADISKKLVSCMTDESECGPGGGDKSESLNKFETEAQNALQAGSKDLAEKAVEEGIAKAAEEGSKKLLTVLAGSSALGVAGIITGAAGFVHDIGTRLDSGAFQKLHAQAVGEASAVLAATTAGLADQTKAGDLPISTSFMLANQFDGLEQSYEYNVINNGQAVGTPLGPLEKVGENASLPGFLSGVKTTFDIARGPLDVWYTLVNVPINFVTAPIGDVTSWVINHIPGVQALMDKITPYISDIVTGLLKAIGSYIDPMAVGAKFYGFIMQGFLVMFNGNAQDYGMRKLSEAQAAAVDNEIQQERLAELKQAPLAERLFDINNSNSLLANLATLIPGSSVTSPISTLASMSLSMVSRAPTNLARLTTSNALAASSIESLFDIDAYGGTTNDMDAELDPGVEDRTIVCPANNPNSFNHCSVDRDIVDSMNCQFVTCPDLDPAPATAAAPDISVNADVQQLATQILALSPSKITFDDANNAEDGAKQDLIRASNGTQTHCGNTRVALDPALLRAILAAASKYSFMITAMVSDHECDGLMHPKGKAVDIDLVNGKAAIDGADNALYRQFATDMSSYMTTGGRIGQKNDSKTGRRCLGDLTLQNNVQQINDVCTHIHIDVP